jgi:hypothetical protein
MLDAGRLQSARIQLGEGDELSVIAAAALGGTSFFEGKGIVVGSVVGALMIGLENNGLLLMGLESRQRHRPRPHHRARGVHHPLEGVTAGQGSRKGVPT